MVGARAPSELVVLEKTLELRQARCELGGVTVDMNKGQWIGCTGCPVCEESFRKV